MKGLIGILILAVVFSSVCFAEVPQLINYQGRLTDTGGEPVPDGPYLINFRIFGSEAGDDSLWWSGFQTVQVADGLFSYQLGSNEPLPSDFFGPGSDPFLGIIVNTDPEITPRTPITSVAFAWHSNTTDSASTISDNGVTTSKVANYAITEMKIADNSIHAGHIQDHSIIGSDIGHEEITGANIDNGTIGFEDIGPNGANEGQVMKWLSGNWTPADDDAGSSSDGDITAVYASSGLTGGGETGDVSLSIAELGVGNMELANNSVSAAKMQNNSVWSDHIMDGEVGTAELANNSVGNSKLQYNSVWTDQIMDNQVTTPKIQNDAINSSKIYDGSIVAADLANQSVTSAKIQDGTINSADIAEGGIELTNIDQSGATDGQAITWNDGELQWEPSSVGDITSVTTPVIGGLYGGGEAGDLELGIRMDAISNGLILDGTILDEDIWSSADIEPFKIRGTAVNLSDYQTITGQKIFDSLRVTETTRRQSISHSAFTPQSSTASYTRDAAALKNGVTSSQYFYAPVLLPDGCTISNIGVTYYDNEGAQNGSWFLYRISKSSGIGVSIASGNTSGTPGMTTVIDETIDGPTVDNDLYFYTIRARLSYSASPDNMKLYGAEIEYTITKPLP